MELNLSDPSRPTNTTLQSLYRNPDFIPLRRSPDFVLVIPLSKGCSKILIKRKSTGSQIRLNPALRSLRVGLTWSSWFNSTVKKLNYGAALVYPPGQWTAVPNVISHSSSQYTSSA